MKIGKKSNGTIFWQEYINGKRIRKQNVEWKTYKEARKDYEQYIKDLESEALSVPGMKYIDLVNEYIKHLSLSRKMSTVRGQENMLGNVLLEYFKGTELEYIDAAYVKDVQLKLLDKEYMKSGTSQKYSNGYLTKLQTSLRSLFNFGKKFDFMDKNPFDIVPFAKRMTYQEKPKMTILSKIEFDMFMSVIDEQVYITLFNILYWCGLRIGELSALRIKDYDVHSKMLHVYKTYDSKNRVITTTKTGNDRLVSVPDICSKEIEKLLEVYRNGSYEVFDDNSYLFSYDGIIAKTNLDRRKNEYINLSNEKWNNKIPYFTFHQLRHTHVSTLINLGMKPKDIAVRVGHTVEMVNNTYSHLFPEREDLLLERLNNFSLE